MLHGAGADENSYTDMNHQQMLHLAEQHGYVVVSPLGYSRPGAYGTPLRLPAVFRQPEIAAKQRAAVTPEAEHSLELKERDVINVLEIVLNEYPIGLRYFWRDILWAPVELGTLARNTCKLSLGGFVPCR